MAGMKIVYTLDQSILNRENIFYCLKELHCRRLVLVRFCLMIVVLLLFFSHIKKKWHNKIYQFTHVRDFYRLHLRYWIFLLKWTFNLVDFLSLKLSLICNLMLSVFNSARYKHLQSLLRTITKRLNKEI